MRRHWRFDAARVLVYNGAHTVMKRVMNRRCATRWSGLLSLLAASVLLSGCISFYVGEEARSPRPGRAGTVAAQPKRDVTFSVQYMDDFAPGGWFDKEGLEQSIREELQGSGLFDEVRLVPQEEAGERHCHFRILKSGSMVYNRTVSGLACGLTLGVIPGWNTMKLEWDMSYSLRGQELLMMSSLQEGSEMIWLPAVVLMPFQNRADVCGRMVQEPLESFVQQVRRKRLNEQM